MCRASSAMILVDVDKGAASMDLKYLYMLKYKVNEVFFQSQRL